MSATTGAAAFVAEYAVELTCSTLNPLHKLEKSHPRANDSLLSGNTASAGCPVVCIIASGTPEVGLGIPGLGLGGGMQRPILSHQVSVLAGN